MSLKDAPEVDRASLLEFERWQLVDMIQDLETRVFHNRQLFEYACKEHCHDLREIELELSRAGIPEDDGYACFTAAERIKMLAKKVKE